RRVHERSAQRAFGNEQFSSPFSRKTCLQADAAARLANCPRRFSQRRPPRQSPYAAPQLRHTHGGERRRSQDRPDHPGSRRYFDYGDLHTRGARPSEDCLSEASSASQSKGMNSLGIYGGTGVPARARDRRARWPAVKSAKSSIAEKSAQEFLRSLRERNTSPHTIKAYSGDLQNFCAY